MKFEDARAEAATLLEISEDAKYATSGAIWDYPSALKRAAETIEALCIRAEQSEARERQLLDSKKYERAVTVENASLTFELQQLNMQAIGRILRNPTKVEIFDGMKETG